MGCRHGPSARFWSWCSSKVPWCGKVKQGNPFGGPNTLRESPASSLPLVKQCKLRRRDPQDENTCLLGSRSCGGWPTILWESFKHRHMCVCAHQRGAISSSRTRWLAAERHDAAQWTLAHRLSHRPLRLSRHPCSGTAWGGTPQQPLRSALIINTGSS